MNAPEVSIIVVTYNRAHTLRQCLDSILMQTYSSKEILVVDDGSTDDTAQIVRAYGEKILYHPLEHQGLSRARNSALALARGKWIAYLDSDDYYLYPDVIRDYLGRFQEDRGLVAVSSGWRIVDDAGRTLADVTPWTDAPEFDLESCLIWKPTIISSKMFRREALEGANGFDPVFESGMDTDLIFRLLLSSKRIGWLRKITYCYRQSADAMLRNAPRQAKFLRRAVDAVFASPKLPSSLRGKESKIRYGTELWLAWYLWSRGFAAEATAALIQARSLHREAAFIQAKNWWRAFQENSNRTGSRNISQSDFLAVALPAFTLSANGQQQLEDLLDWWWTVWSRYAENPPSENPISLSAKPLTVPRLVELTKRCIHSAKEPAPAQTVARFWNDVLLHGWVRPEEKGSVVTLYLACFTRALAARKIGAAGSALGRALRATQSRKALSAWNSFFQSAVRALLFGEKSSAEEAI